MRKMTLFAHARRRTGWEEGRITRFLVLRGLLLIFLQIFVEDPAWILGDLQVGPGVLVIRGGRVPGGGAEGMIYLGVLFGLGGAMALWALMRRAPSCCFWLLGLVILYPLCYRYNGFKCHKPLTSFWRFF